MENGWALVRELLSGHRMEKPEYSPNFMREMMKNCWKVNPKERPTFSQLSETIEKYIEISVTSDYLNMNDPANEIGSSLFEETEVDPVSNKWSESCQARQRRITQPKLGEARV
jgi:hypothetical protein